MRTITGKNVKSILALLFFTVSLVGVAQTKKEAVDAFNEGVTLVKTDPDGAIKAFNKCIELSEQLGEEGDETKLAAEQQQMNAQLFDSISSFITEYNTPEKYQVILGHSIGGSMLYGSDQLDITSNIVSGLNNRYGKDE